MFWMGTLARGALLVVFAVVVTRRQAGRTGRDASPHDVTSMNQNRYAAPVSVQCSAATARGWMQPAAWIISPIAAPAWIAESIVRRRLRRFWEFDMWSGTFYLLGVIALGLWLLTSTTTSLRIVGFYMLSATELLGLLVVGALPAGQLGGYASSLRGPNKR